MRRRGCVFSRPDAVARHDTWFHTKKRRRRRKRRGEADEEEVEEEEETFDGTLLSYLDLPEEDRVVEDLFHHPPEEHLAYKSDEADEPEDHQPQPTSPSRGTFAMDHYKIVNQNSCQGLPSDSESTSKLYRRVHKRYCVFASEVDLNDNQQPNVSKLWLVADRDVNWFLVLWFVDFYVTP